MKYIAALLLCTFFLTSCIGPTQAPTAGTVPNTANTDALKAFFLEKADKVRINEDSVTFTDASGDGTTELTVKKCPSSVFCLYPSFTALWYEAGGSVTGCIGGEPAAALYSEYIGRDITKDDSMTVVATTAAGKSWDIETVISKKPELIICSAAMSGYSTVKAPAAAADIPIIVVDYDDFSDYLKWFKVFSNLTGRPELWESIALEALNKVTDILASCPTENTPSVFCMFAASERLKANTSGTVLGGMISAMGAKNIIESEHAERIAVNLEAVYAADPDIILVQCHSDVTSARELVEKLYGDDPVWQSLSAVKTGRVYYLEPSLFHNKPNSRFPEAYLTLAEYLYPDIKSD